MKHFRNLSLGYIFIFAILYSLGAVSEGTFNITNWSGNTRGVVVGFTCILYACYVLMYFITLDDKDF